MDDDSGEIRYLVVVNGEDQYSIWVADRDIPSGWKAEGTEGSRQHCLDYIDRVWTDMRPRSLREQMAVDVESVPTELS